MFNPLSFIKVSPRTARVTWFGRLLPAALVVMLTQCSIADLRDAKLREGVTEQARARGLELMRKAALAHGMKADGFKPGVSPLVEARGKDVWYSSLMRRFTPLDRNSQSFRMTLKKGGDRFEVLNGESKGRVLGREGARYFTIAAAKGSKPVYEDSSAAFIYLESLRLYMELPFLAAGMGNVAYMGRENIGGRPHELVFTSPGGFEPSDKADQYVFALDAETNRITYVRFTYRKVFSFYKGVLRYDDFRALGDLLMPHRIAILDAADDDEPVHEIILDEVRVK